MQQQRDFTTQTFRRLLFEAVNTLPFNALTIYHESIHLVVFWYHTFFTGDRKLILDGICSFQFPRSFDSSSPLITLLSRLWSHVSFLPNMHRSAGMSLRFRQREEDLNRAQVLAAKKNHEPDQNFLSTLLSSSCN